MVLFHMVYIVSADLTYYLYIIITMCIWACNGKICSMAGWMTEEMRALLGLWGAADVQAQLNVVQEKSSVPKDCHWHE